MFVLVDLVDIASYANDNDKVMLMITLPPPPPPPPSYTIGKNESNWK